MTMSISGSGQLSWRVLRSKEGKFIVKFRVVVAPNSYVPAGSRLPENTLWAGNPVTFVKSLESVEKRVGQDKGETIKLEIVEEGQV